MIKCEINKGNMHIECDGIANDLLNELSLIVSSVVLNLIKNGALDINDLDYLMEEMKDYIIPIMQDMEKQQKEQQAQTIRDIINKGLN